MKRLILFFLIVVTNSYGKTLVISDIDDTLKVSHVRSWIDAAKNAPAVKNSFIGSAELFQFLNEEIPDTEFFYVSNAPKRLMGRLHNIFISINDYPAGQIFLREQYNSDEHKLRTIYNIIASNPADRVILFGDNGEKDIIFYNEIARIVQRNFPQIQLYQFIHHLYEDGKTYAYRVNQIPFVTSLDVLAHFFKDKEIAINQESLADFAHKQAGVIILQKKDKKSLLFPQWLQCVQFQSRDTLDFLPLARLANLHVQKICNP